MEPPSSLSQKDLNVKGFVPTVNGTLAVSIVDEADSGLDHEVVERAVTATLARSAPSGADVSILLTTDEEIRRLNREYRLVDEPTDVLTFPSGEGESGDIAIAIPYARRQALKRGVRLEEEVAYLAIHGALHLLGMDDDNEEDRMEMILAMNNVARTIGLAEDHEWGSILHEGQE